MSENGLIPLSKEAIDEIFQRETEQDEPHQRNILIDLYKLVFPNWDNIVKVNGYPQISKETNLYLFDKFIKFDKVYHPNVMNGGLWMNNGFSSLDSERLPSWVIKPCEAEYKGEA